MTDAASIVPHLNPEITWGSIGVMLTMVFSFGGAYALFSSKIATNAQDIVDLRTDLKTAIENINKTHVEAMTELRVSQKEIAKDLRTHITSVSEQHLQMMALFADLKLQLAMSVKDIESLQKLQDQFSNRMNIISDRQTEFLKSNMAAFSVPRGDHS